MYVYVCVAAAVPPYLTPRVQSTVFRLPLTNVESLVVFDEGNGRVRIITCHVHLPLCSHSLTAGDDCHPGRGLAQDRVFQDMSQ